MIYVRFTDRLGNHLFQLAAAYSLTDKITICADDPDVHRNIMNYKDIFFRNIPIIDYIPSGVKVYTEPEFRYHSIPYKEGDDLIIKGYFQSYKYVDINRMRLLYRMPDFISQKLKEKYGSLLCTGFNAIHVRRGDYMNMLYKHPFAGSKYYHNAIKALNSDLPFIVVSDDITWCKKNFHGNQFYFSERNSFLEDFFIQTLASNNIISNSSFSLWAAMLNSNSNRKVYAPSLWFGYQSGIDFSDLLPDSFEIIHNNYTFVDFFSSILQLLNLKIKYLFNLQ